VLVLIFLDENGDCCTVGDEKSHVASEILGFDYPI